MSDEWMSADSGATASGDASHSSPDGDLQITWETAGANAARIGALTETVDWLTKLVVERPRLAEQGICGRRRRDGAARVSVTEHTRLRES